MRAPAQCSPAIKRNPALGQYKYVHITKVRASLLLETLTFGKLNCHGWSEPSRQLRCNSPAGRQMTVFSSRVLDLKNFNMSQYHAPLPGKNILNCPHARRKRKSIMGAGCSSSSFCRNGMSARKIINGEKWQQQGTRERELLLMTKSGVARTAAVMSWKGSGTWK